MEEPTGRLTCPVSFSPMSLIMASSCQQNSIMSHSARSPLKVGSWPVVTVCLWAPRALSTPFGKHFQKFLTLVRRPVQAQLPKVLALLNLEALPVPSCRAVPGREGLPVSKHAMLITLMKKIPIYCIRVYPIAMQRLLQLQSMMAVVPSCSL